MFGLRSLSICANSSGLAATCSGCDGGCKHCMQPTSRTQEHMVARQRNVSTYVSKATFLRHFEPNTSGALRTAPQYRVCIHTYMHAYRNLNLNFYFLHIYICICIWAEPLTGVKCTFVNKKYFTSQDIEQLNKKTHVFQAITKQQLNKTADCQEYLRTS